MCTTMSGRAIYPTNSGVPSLDDIALSLSRMPRFAGHTRQPFTVLHHLRLCYLLAEGMIAEFRNPRARAIAVAAILLHDAEESILGDMPSTWKNAVPEVKALFKGLNRRINAFYLGMPVPDWAEEMIEVVDILSLQAEMLEVAPYECWEHSGQAWIIEKGKLDDERLLAQQVAAEPAVDLRQWYIDTLERELAAVEAVHDEVRGAVEGVGAGGGLEGGMAAVVFSLLGRERAPGGNSEN